MPAVPRTSRETPEWFYNPHSGRWIPDHTHRQRHINVAIAYNIWQYYQVTEDHEFLYFYGAEMLLEIARFWASIATYNSSIDRYEITGVMGPDEYHTAYPGADPEAAGGIHNNAYTNVMVAWVLERARDVLALLPPAHCRQLCERLGLTEADLAQWDELSRKLRVPLHGDGIISQFDGYGDLEPFDWPGYQERYDNIQRLDRILEAEYDTPNRYQVSKQADVLMLFYLLSAEELTATLHRLGHDFDPATPATVASARRTTHGSTLQPRCTPGFCLAATVLHRGGCYAKHSTPTWPTRRVAPPVRASTWAPWSPPPTSCSAATPGWKPEATPSASTPGSRTQ